MALSRIEPAMAASKRKLYEVSLPDTSSLRAISYLIPMSRCSLCHRPAHHFGLKMNGGLEQNERR
jgi:hypothetical protein